MKNYTNSDYALNKYSEGIVYRFADKIVEVTLSDYLAENPGSTAADFAALKAESDKDYREQDRKENAQTKKNVSFEELEESDLFSVPSPEDVYFEALDKTEQRQQRLEIAKQALNKMTDVQCKRYLMHVVDGLSTRQIAELEGVAQRSIMDCLEAVEKKIQNILKNS